MNFVSCQTWPSADLGRRLTVLRPARTTATSSGRLSRPVLDRVSFPGARTSDRSAFHASCGRLFSAPRKGNGGASAVSGASVTSGHEFHREPVDWALRSRCALIMSQRMNFVTVETDDQRQPEAAPSFGLESMVMSYVCASSFTAVRHTKTCPMDSET